MQKCIGRPPLPIQIFTVTLNKKRPKPGTVQKGVANMADNLAYQGDYEEKYRREVLNGAIVLMSPRPQVNHNRIAKNITYAFEQYLRGKKCEAFPDGTDVYLTEKDIVIPDVMIVCDKDKIKPDGIHGTPDLIVEVLSRSTEKRDKGYKKIFTSAVACWNTGLSIRTNAP